MNVGPSRLFNFGPEASKEIPKTLYNFGTSEETSTTSMIVRPSRLFNFGTPKPHKRNEPASVVSPVQGVRPSKLFNFCTSEFTSNLATGAEIKVRA